MRATTIWGVSLVPKLNLENEMVLYIKPKQ